MITLPFSTFVIGFVVLGLLFFMFIWLFYDHRDHDYYDRMRLRRVHQCVKCGAVYTSRDELAQVACPECGFENPPLQF